MEKKKEAFFSTEGHYGGVWRGGQAGLGYSPDVNTSEEVGVAGRTRAGARA